VREDNFRALFETRATKERVLHLCECAEYPEYILKRTLCLICRIPFVNRWRLSIPKCQIELTAIYFQSLEMFIIQIGQMAFCKSEFIIIKSKKWLPESSKRRMLF
jgi:hypothetical protein